MTAEGRRRRRSRRRLLSHSLLVLVLLFATAEALAAGGGIRRRFRQEWRVGRVEFRGNPTFSRFILLDRMVTKPSWLLNRVPYSEQVLQDDIAMIKAFYRNQGFLEAEVAVESLELDSLRRRAAIVVRVWENQRTHVDAIIFKGGAVLPDSLLGRAVKTRVGKPLISSDVESDGRSILAMLTDRGHLEATVEPIVDLDRERHRARVTFAVRDGPVVRAGTVTVSGLKSVQRVVVDRELTFASGDTLTTRGIASSTSRLYRTDLFRRVQVLPRAPDTASRVPAPVAVTSRDVDVKLEENKMFQVEAGAGYGTNEALRASLGASYRNLFGLGKRVSLNARLSSRVQRIELGYSDGRPLGIPLSLDLSGYYGHHNEWAYQPGVRGLLLPFTGSDIYAYHANIGGFRFSVGMATQARISWSASLRWEDVRYLAGTMDTTVDSVNARRTQSLSATVAYDGRNDVLNPDRGAYAAITAEVAGLGGAGTNQFVKASGDLRWFLPVRNLAVFSTGGRIGYVRRYGSSVDVPIQERFRAGGSTSLRGFRDNMVGPLLKTDSTLIPVGGRLLVVLHPLEVRFPIYKALWGGVFVDAGNVWAGAAEFRPDGLNWGAGTGLRVNLPLGVVRLDAGLALKTNPDYPRSAFGAVHFDIGQAF